MDYDDLSTIIKASSNTKRLIIRSCTIKPPGTLDFTIQQHYNIQFLSFYYSGDYNFSNWLYNKNEFLEIVKAINSSGLQQLIHTFDICGCGVDTSEITVAKAKAVKLDKVSPMK